MAFVKEAMRGWSRMAPNLARLAKGEDRGVHAAASPTVFAPASVPSLVISGGKTPEPLKKFGERLDDPLLLVAVVRLPVEP